MNCHISVEMPDKSVRSIWIREGQTVQFGRTDWADFTIPSDPMMSRLHFAIDSDNSKSLLRDLGSRNGTFVNGQAVSSCELADGDEIVAGETRFKVSLAEPRSRWKPEDAAPAGQVPPANAPQTADRSDEHSVASLIEAIRATGKLGDETILLDELERRTVNPAFEEQTLALDGLNLAQPAQRGDHFTYDEIEGPGGATHYCSTARRARPIDVAKKLVSRRDYYVIVNVQKMEPAAQAFFSSRSPGQRFSRVNDDLVVIGPQDTVDRLEVFSRGWGRDAIMGIVSRLASDHLLDRIRSSANRFMFPSLLLRDLRRAPSSQVFRLLADLDAVFLEDSSHDQWTLVINPLCGFNWETLGLPGPPSGITRSGTDTA
jgi:pSer/pThr/pTyr-binding forkhead associated (FHA) protein